MMVIKMVSKKKIIDLIFMNAVLNDIPAVDIVYTVKSEGEQVFVSEIPLDEIKYRISVYRLPHPRHSLEAYIVLHEIIGENKWVPKLEVYRDLNTVVTELKHTLSKYKENGAMYIEQIMKAKNTDVPIDKIKEAKKKVIDEFDKTIKEIENLAYKQ